MAVRHIKAQSEFFWRGLGRSLGHFMTSLRLGTAVRRRQSAP